MKVKQDFITNSSSMNFIIRGATTGKILREIVKIHYNDWKQHWGCLHEGAEKTLDFLDAHKDFNKNVIYPWTCNYVSYIFKISKNQVRVETCNNYDWWKYGVQNMFSVKVPYEDYDNLSDHRSFLDLTDMTVKTGKKFRVEEWEALQKRIKEPFG